MKRFASYIILFVCSGIVSLYAFSSIRKTNNPNFPFQNVQKHQINGKVVDEMTGEPIPYCNIVLDSSYYGTSSNILGEFVIEVDSLPAELIFTHINYKKFIVEIFETSDIKVELTPLATQLEGVTVSALRKDDQAYVLARKALEKVQGATNRPRYGKAFYRQKSKNGEAFSEFSEIIYDIQYNARGISDWDILEGRYALKKKGVFNKNFTLLSRLFPPVQPDTDEIIFPLHPNFDVYYDVRVVDYIISGNDKIAVLSFKPKIESGIPKVEGEVYIDTKSHDILKIAGSLARDDIKFVQLAEKKSDWKGYKIAYELAYRHDNIFKTVIDYIKVDQEFDYYKNDSLQFRASSTSNLTFFEHYMPTSRKKIGSQFKKNRSDWEKLDEIGYNGKFWEENPIVKRTPVEKEVIEAFQKDSAFGTIFLNSRNQVVLMQSDVDDDPVVKDLEQKMSYFNEYSPVEKVYLHTDNDTFSAGETIWYSGYTVLGPYHHYSMGSKVLHVDLIDSGNSIVVSQTHEIINGKSSGSITLPKNLLPGEYQLRSYTQWMRNFDNAFFFTKTIELLNQEERFMASVDKANKTDLQFFPEGGYAVDNLISQVAFKAVGDDGLEKKVQGQVLNSEGKFVATLGSISRGAGFFSFKPMAGERYTAVLNDGTKYLLPEIMKQGYVLTVNNTSPKSILVKVQATPTLRKNPIYLIGHMNQKKYYQGRFEFGDRSTIQFEIPKNKFPSGVMTFTLFDTNKKPWCERLVFINNQDELVINARIDSQEFNKRNKITLDVHVTDTYGTAISTELSIAVTDAGQIIKDPRSSNILTYLLLQSDIKGHISDPVLLFKDQNRTTLHQLDLIMLTHGWRKLPWQEILNGEDINKKFDFAKGLTITGIARNRLGKLLANTLLRVIAKSQDSIGMLSTNTSNIGTFSIDDFNFRDSTEIVFNAADTKNQPISTKITIDTPTMAPPLPMFNDSASKIKNTKKTKDYSAISAMKRKNDSLYTFGQTTVLDEVVVTEKKIEKRLNSSPSVYGQTPDATLYAAENESALTVIDLVQRFPGVTVSRNTVTIRNGGTPLWVLNGIPVNNENPSASALAQQEQQERAATARAAGDASPVAIDLPITRSVQASPAPTFIANMSTFTVERIELIKGPSAAIYGSRGANGVILIYTLRGGEETIKNILAPDFTVFGHAAQREFYSPAYDIELDRHNAPDYRSTLYWNPSFSTDINGNARLTFYTSDIADRIQVAIEGLSALGIPGAYLKTFGSTAQNKVEN